MRHTQLLALAGLLAMTASASGRGYFDGHVHVNEPGSMLALMERHQIPRAVVFWGGNTDNREIVEAARRHPDKLVPFLSVSPERLQPYGQWWRDGDAALLAYAERELRTGAYRGHGELSIVHFPSRGFPEAEYSPAHPLMTGLMGLALKYRLPVMIHCEMTYAREFAALLARYPAVPVIWAHGGYAPLYWVERMLARHPNLTIDLSMRLVADHPRSPDYWILKSPGQLWPRWLELIKANPTRFVSGSDSSQRDPEVDAARIASMEILLPRLTPAARQRRRSASEALLLGSWPPVP